MSQSDYIQYKKLSQEIKQLSKYDPVLSQQDYTLFKQYTLESTITNTKPIKNQLVLSGKQPIFNMERKISNCPINSFVLCRNTNTRINRKLNTLNLERSEMTLNNQKTIVSK